MPAVGSAGYAFEIATNLFSCRVSTAIVIVKTAAETEDIDVVWNRSVPPETETLLQNTAARFSDRGDTRCASL